MKDNIDIEGIFKDLLQVMSKHSIPANTISLEISLLPQEFENFSASHDPGRFTTGVFHKSMKINDSIPATLRIKRRLPFDEIATRLESNILPMLQTWGKELEHDFENMRINVNAVRSDNHLRLPNKHSYIVYIECRPKESTKPSDGDLMLSVSLSQHDATSYPSISADVGMLVDEEGDGDWGNARITSLFSAQEVHENLLDRLEKSLPWLYQSLRISLGKSDVK